ncbi:hypothetical protein KKE45_03080, partial [Patescibacteria group bacterium]|nr:hypothetical protein [Patescibacteria group bacterium]
YKIKYFINISTYPILLLLIGFQILNPSLILATRDIHQINSPESFEQRKVQWINATIDWLDTEWAKNGGDPNETDYHGGVYAMLIFYLAEQTDDYSKVPLANQRVLQSARNIDEIRSDEKQERRVSIGNGLDYSRLVLMYRDKPDLLYPSSLQKLLNGIEPPNSGFPSNENESLRYFQKEVTFSDYWGIGIHKYNPWRPQNGTENHLLNYIAQGLLISEIYKDETYNPKDGSEVSMKDQTTQADDYWHYWKDAFFFWLIGGPNSYSDQYHHHHLDYGIREKDSATYGHYFLGSLWLILDFVDDPNVKQYAEMYLDLLMADRHEEVLGGLYTGTHTRSSQYYQALREKPGIVISGYLLFDNIPYQINSDLGSLLHYAKPWINTSIAFSKYNPTHPNFPHVLTSLAVNKPETGYLVTEAECNLEETKPSTAEANWITTDYSLGFFLNNTYGDAGLNGGFYVDNGTDRESGLAIIPFAGSNEGFNTTNGTPHTRIYSLVAQDVAITRHGRDTHPAKIWIKNGFSSSYSNGWMFYQAKTSSNKNIYIAINPVSADHGSDGNLDPGSVRNFSKSTVELIWEVSDSTRHISFDNFQDDIIDNPLTDSGGIIEYTSGRDITLRFFRNDYNSSQINGQPINWDDYKYVVKNPWISWPWKTQTATMSKDGYTAEYDFDANNDGVFNDPVKTVNNNSLAPTNTPQPSTPSPTSPPLSCTPPCHFGNALRANGTCDNDINMSDYATWFREFFNNETTLYADFNRDGVVNRDDLPQWINKCYETGYGCAL